MALNIQVIQGSDGVAASRLTINNNFSVLKGAASALLSFLNTDTGALSGLSSASISNTAVSLSTSVLGVGNSALIAGNLSLGTEGQSTGLTVLGTGGVNITNGDATLGNGNLSLNSTSNGLSVKGFIKNEGEIRNIGVVASFTAPKDLNVDISPIQVSGLKYVVLKNSNTTQSKTTTIAAGTQGQILDIVLYNSSNTYREVGITNVVVKGSTDTTTVGLSQSGDRITVVYEGNTWYLLTATPISLLTSSNSITIS